MDPTTRSAINHPVRNALLTAASLVVILAGARFASDLLVPLMSALFIAIILDPLIRMLRDRGLSEWLAITVVSIFGLGALALLFLLLGASVNAFIDTLPVYQAQLSSLLDAWARSLADFGLEIDRDDFAAAFDPGAAVGLFGTFLSGLGGTLSHLFILLFTVVFILGEASNFQKKLSSGLLGSRNRNMSGLQELMASMNNYLTTKTLISLLTGILVGFGLWMMDVQFAMLWGFGAFLLNFVPNIGSIIAAIPPVLLSLLERDPLLTGAIILLYLAVNTLIGNVVEPRVMGKRMGLSTLAVFVSLLFWGWMFGPVGMLLSVPLTMLIRFVAEQQPGSAWFAVLVSPAPTPRK